MCTHDSYKKGLTLITAKRINTIVESWGMDVVVRFTEALRKIDITKTFTFIDQKQIDLEYEGRMTKAIANIENVIVENKKPESLDIIERIQTHYETNLTMSKTEYETFKTTELARSTSG